METIVITVILRRCSRPLGQRHSPLTSEAISPTQVKASCQVPAVYATDAHNDRSVVGRVDTQTKGIDELFSRIGRLPRSNDPLAKCRGRLADSGCAVRALTRCTEWNAVYPGSFFQADVNIAARTECAFE